MPRKHSQVWLYYNQKKVGNKKIGVCKYCKQQYLNNATRMQKHLAKCMFAPLEIKKHFKDEADENVEEVSTNLKDIKSYN